MTCTHDYSVHLAKKALSYIYAFGDRGRIELEIDVAGVLVYIYLSDFVPCP